MNFEVDLLGAPLRARIPHLSSAIIKSGTSRFVVLRDEELPTGRARAKVILDLLANTISTDGLGGSHYQSNKVAVLTTTQNPESFKFHFYQVIPQTGRLFSKMECSNAASASGLAGMLLGVTRTREDGAMACVNEATHQTVEVIPPPGAIWEGDWGVRFTRLHHLWLHMTKTAVAFDLEANGVAVSGHIVRHGNVFVIVRMPIVQVTPELVAALNARGEDFLREIGHPETLPKVLIYDIHAVDGLEMQCEATCYSEGQQHHSLPGSGAMALGAFLTAHGAMSLPESEPSVTTVFKFAHPSGVLTAHIHLSRGASHWEIHATSFDTPVRLLMLGSLIPRRG